MRFSDPISQRQAAELLKCSKGQIYKLIQQNKIHQDERGKLSKKEVLKYAVVTEVDLPEGTNFSAHSKAKPTSANKMSIQDIDEQQLKTLTKDDILSLVPEDPQLALDIATALERIFKQERQKLLLEKEQGLLIETRIISQEFENIAIKVRQELMAIPPRLAGRLEGLNSREIETLLEKELVEALRSLEYKNDAG